MWNEGKERRGPTLDRSLVWPTDLIDGATLAFAYGPVALAWQVATRPAEPQLTPVVPPLGEPGTGTCPSIDGGMPITSIANPSRQSPDVFPNLPPGCGSSATTIKADWASEALAPYQRGVGVVTEVCEVVKMTAKMMQARYVCR